MFKDVYVIDGRKKEKFPFEYQKKTSKIRYVIRQTERL